MRARKALIQTSPASPQLTRELSRYERRRVAFIADVDERTVARRLRGKPTKPGARERIDAVLVELGAIEDDAGSSVLTNIVARAVPR